MTQDEIIKMAKESNLLGVIDCFHYTGRQTWVEEATAFAKLVAAKHDPKIAIADAYRAGVDSGIAAEREACLKICEAQASTNYWEGADVCAESIRARGEA